MHKRVPAKFSTNRPILVLGGGIAGLSAAWELKQHGVPVRAQLL